MMLLSRFWYAILAVALGAGVALLYVSVHQHNRLRETDTYEIVNHDLNIVDWFLQLDSRRRVGAIGIVSVDSAVRSAIVKANGQEKIGADVREPLKKRLTELANKIGPLVRDEPKGTAGSPIALFAVDVHGRVVAQVNFDREKLTKDDGFELGGFPVVVEALHGWLRDDTWVFDRNAIYRVVARPVIYAEDAPPVGAIVSLRRVDDSFAQLVAEKTKAPVVFYVAAPDSPDNTVFVTGKAAPDGPGISFDGYAIDATMLKNDKFYNDTLGASALKSDKQQTFMYSRMVGAGWDMGAGFAVGRKVVSVADPMAVLSGADETDKKWIPIPIVAGVVVLVLLIGIFFTWLEHGLPTSKLLREARRFGKGEQDALPLAKLSGPYRKIGQDVNEGLERVIAKGGGASRKAADLEQILGPVPAAPQMSAFAFNFDQQPPPSSPSGAGAPKGAPQDLFPNLPPAGPAAAAPIVSGSLGAPPRMSPAPAKPTKPAPPSPAPAPAIPSVSAPISSGRSEEEDDEATMVARIPEELMKASATGEQKAIDNADELMQWRQTFDEFVTMRQKCGEPTTGLSFEKFQGQLRKNKEQLVKQYSCRRVKFTVYEKDGKAALKATPIKD